MNATVRVPVGPKPPMDQAPVSSCTARAPSPCLTDSATRNRLFRLAYRILWNRDDAEDAVQESLAKALSDAGRLRDQEKWWPWICRILITQCHQLGRRKSRQRRLVERLVARRVEAESEEPRFDRDESPNWIASLLGELPSRQRDVMVLRHLEGLSYEEVAVILAIAPATARVHAQQGRERLLKLVEERDPEGKRR